MQLSPHLKSVLSSSVTCFLPVLGVTCLVVFFSVCLMNTGTLITAVILRTPGMGTNKAHDQYLPCGWDKMVRGKHTELPHICSRGKRYILILLTCLNNLLDPVFNKFILMTFHISVSGKINELHVFCCVSNISFYVPKLPLLNLYS